jgi:hypothetical protein
MEDPSNIWVDNALWEYQFNAEGRADYIISDELIPWHGCWVFNADSQDVQIYIPNKALLPLSKETGVTPAGQSASYKEWTIKLAAAKGKLADSSNFFGVSENASTYYDPKDLAEPPLIADEQVSLYFSHQAWPSRARNYATDFRPPILSEEQYDFIVDTGQGPKQEIVLSWDGLDQVPYAYEIWLRDVESGKAVNMREEASYNLLETPGIKRSFQVIVNNTTGSLGLNIKNILDRHSYSSGDTLIWDISLEGEGHADGYLVVVLPTNDFVCLVDIKGNTAPLNQPIPIARNIPISPGNYHIFTYTLTGQEAKGQYYLYSILVKPGADPLETKNWIAQDSYVFTVK